jgi:hypothetical protein
MYIDNTGVGTIQVLPKNSGTLFGLPVGENRLSTLTTTADDNGTAMAFDTAGDLFMAEYSTGDITVLPRSTGTLFGVSVIANVKTTVATGAFQPTGLAFDNTGNLFIAGPDGLDVLPEATGTVFGQSVSADTVSPIASATTHLTDLAFDTEGNLFMVNGPVVSVLPSTTGVLFGQTVTANDVSLLSTSFLTADSVAVDGAGNVFVGDDGSHTLSVLSATSGSIFGHTVSADGFSTLFTSFGEPVGLAFDANGDLFVVGDPPVQQSIAVLPTTSGTIFGNQVTADVLNPITTGTEQPSAMAFDAQGNLFITTGFGQILTIPKTDGTLFGRHVTAGEEAVLFDDPSLLAISTSIAVDAAGDLFIGSYQPDIISVIARSNGTIFGKAVTANVPTTLTADADLPESLAFDSEGDLLVANGSPNGAPHAFAPIGQTISQVQVMSVQSGVSYGQRVAADQLSTLVSGPDNAISLSVDGSGDVFFLTISQSNDALWVLAGSSTHVFGTNVAADTATEIPNATDEPDSIAVDTQGDLYVSNETECCALTVLPRASGMLFGSPVTANDASPITLDEPQQLPYFDFVFDPQGNLFGLDTSGDISELPNLAPPTTTVTTASATPGRATAGSSVTFSAIVTSTQGVPTGTTTFSIGDTSLCTTGPLLGGMASCNSTQAPVGLDDITATYSGSADSALSSGTTTLKVFDPNARGYWLVGSDGGIFSFGAAQFSGSTGSLTLQRPVVGITPTADQGGYWLVASDGGTFSFGDAVYRGSIPGLGIAPANSKIANRLNAPIVGMVPSTDDGGYFMVGADGGVFAFGDAHFEGSCPQIGGCNGAAVAVMPDATGNGYWLVTATGHVYTFGDAPYYGAPGPELVPVTSAVRTPDGKGYWILFANGSIGAYGDAANLGSPAGRLGTSNPATAIFSTGDGDGYWVGSATGEVFAYGDAPYDGGMAGTHLNGSIIAATGF